MNKLFKVSVTTIALGIGLVGCNVLNPEESTTPEITITAIGAINAGTFKNVTGQIKAGEAITSIGYSVTNSAGAVIASIEAVGPTSSLEKTLKWETTNAIKITVPANASAGGYNLKITATAGATVDASFPFTVTGGSTGTPIVSTTITAGSNSSSAGSSIDLDAGVAYTMAEAASHVADLDLCYSTTGTGDDKLGSPNWAKLSLYTYATGWASPNATKFYKTALTKAEFDAIATKEQIPTFLDASATAESYVAALNNVFIVKTNLGATVLVLINAQTPGAAGSITIKTAK